MNERTLRNITIRGGLLALAVLAAGSGSRADTIYLQSGDRVEGTLVGVNGRTIEFKENDRGRTRLRRYDRNDVRRIEIDDRGSSGSSSYDDRDRPSSSDGYGGSPNRAGARARPVPVAPTAA